MIKVLTYLSVAVALSACSALAKYPQVTMQNTSGAQVRGNTQGR